MNALRELHEQYLVDADGKKTAVILSLKQYQRLLEDLHDLAAVAERRDEEPISLEEMKRRLAKTMGLYRVEFKPSVQKDLRALPRPMVTRVLDYIEKLAEEPMPRESLKLTGAERLYRVRVGDYRIVYEVDVDDRLVLIHYVRHRREAYRRR